MKTRLIQTDFWNDETIQELSLEAQHLYIFLLTCPQINLCGIFKLSARQISLMCNLNRDQLEKAVSELTAINKVHFFDGFVFVVNALSKNGYLISSKTTKACLKQLAEIPTEVKQHFSQVSGKNLDNPLSEQKDSVSPKVKKEDTVSVDYPCAMDSTNINNNNNIKEKGGVGEKEELILVNLHPTLESVGEVEINEIVKLYHVRLDFVRSKLDDLKHYCRSTGKQYVEYMEALMRFVKNDKHFEQNVIKADIPSAYVNLPPKTPASLEQQQVARQALPPALRARIERKYPLRGENAN